jgi:AmmeMemoRadiSam system protein B
MRSPIAATRKAYATPFGPAPAAQRFLDTLAREYAGNLFEDEFSHRTEHSLEFQALYLRYLGRVGEPAGSPVAPLLCGGLHEWGAGESAPIRDPGVTEAIEALRRTLVQFPGRVCLIAGADLAHVGPQFGDRAPLTPAALGAVAKADREMLDIICQGDAEGFYEQVMADNDARRICGLSPIYYLLSLLGPSRGKLLKYSQWADRAGQGSVTYAGVIFDS